MEGIINTQQGVSLFEPGPHKPPLSYLRKNMNKYFYLCNHRTFQRAIGGFLSNCMQAVTFPTSVQLATQSNVRQSFLC